MADDCFTVILLQCKFKIETAHILSIPFLCTWKVNCRQLLCTNATLIFFFYFQYIVSYIALGFVLLRVDQGNFQVVDFVSQLADFCDLNLHIFALKQEKNIWRYTYIRFNFEQRKCLSCSWQTKSYAKVNNRLPADQR